MKNLSLHLPPGIMGWLFKPVPAFFALVAMAIALVPQAAVAQNTTRFTHIAAGGRHSLALKSDGTVVAWGAGAPGSREAAFINVGQSTVLRGLTGVIAIAAGTFQSLALVADAPALMAQPSSDTVLLSWPLWGQGFALQVTTNLMDESSWTPVLTVPVVAGSRNRVTDPVAGPAKFYRLRK